MENYEADDVIGSLAKWAAEKEGLGVKIITGDRDLLQLVTNRIVVSLPNSRTNTTEDYFPEDVKRKLGVYPEQVVDYKALVGDPSDNIPGVKRQNCFAQVRIPHILAETWRAFVPI